MKQERKKKLESQFSGKTLHTRMRAGSFTAATAAAVGYCCYTSFFVSIIIIIKEDPIFALLRAL